MEIKAIIYLSIYLFMRGLSCLENICIASIEHIYQTQRQNKNSQYQLQDLT